MPQVIRVWRMDTQNLSSMNVEIENSLETMVHVTELLVFQKYIILCVYNFFNTTNFIQMYIKIYIKLIINI